MPRERRRHSSTLILGLTLVAVTYAWLLHFLPSLTGNLRLDGLLGVVLGLYICSHPAANLLDLVLFARQAAPHFPSRSSLLVWLALNLILLAAGWMDIFLGATQLASRAT
ncbi:MAG: hypothetical protein ABSF61_00335 [Anaerolineales bacterium]|jgi:hypothetical protein